MTTIYIMRHSEVLKPNIINNSDSLELQNQKWSLTRNGEKIANQKSNNNEFQNFDLVISSNYVRTIQTAKYFSDKIYIDESFNERKFGIDSWDELPKDFEKDQLEDFNYKMEKGESINEIIKRQYNSLINLLSNNKDKKILIVGHTTALSSLLSKWCKIKEGVCSYNNQIIFDRNWSYLETFKLTFEDTKIISIKHIK